jgi:endonuclease G
MRFIIQKFIILAILAGCTAQHVSEQVTTTSLYSRQATTSPVVAVGDIPDSHPVIERIGFTLGYDGKIKSAGWVYEELTAASVQGDADRSHFTFMEDPLIPEPLRSTLNDYKNSGYDRGHLCPAANTRFSEEAMRETFYLSNISPQHPLLNRKYWVKLEKYIREKAKIYDRVLVVTGPLFLPTVEQDGKRYVKYQVIGDNDVAVPTHYFKVIRCLKAAQATTEAFIIPNAPVPLDAPLQNFAVTLDKVERVAGISFKNHWRSL